MENRYDLREAAAKQVGGNHYSKHNIQPWDIIDEYGLDYHRGNAIKYILRNKMDPYEDIEKAIHYLEHWLAINDYMRTPSETERERHYEATGQLATDEEILLWLRKDMF